MFRAVVVSFNPIMRVSTHYVAEIGKELDQYCYGISFGVRVNDTHYFARETVIRCVVDQRPCAVRGARLWLWLDASRLVQRGG
jgi:hypothetical protein